MIEPNNAGINPFTSNPFTIVPTKKKRRPFIIKTNNPNVSIVMGSVSTTSIGRTSTLSKPSITATIIAGYKPSTTIPSSTYEAVNSPSTTARNLIKMLFISHHSTQKKRFYQTFFYLTSLNTFMYMQHVQNLRLAMTACWSMC